MDKNNKINWELVVAIIALVIGFFGWTAADCMGCNICGSENDGESIGTTSSVVSIPDEVYSTPTESEVESRIEIKTGRKYIKNVKVLSAGCKGDGYEGFEYTFSDSVIANTGNQYTNSLIVNKWLYKGAEAYIELYLNNEYEDFICTVALSDETRDIECRLNVSVLVDNNVVWSRDYKSGTLPENINIDVSNATVLKINISYKNGSNDYGEIIFGDAYFTFAE